MRLLDEIIDLLMNEAGSLNEALLKTKVLLHKIGQKELAEWVNNEISGYNDPESVPSYRIIQARMMGNIANIRFMYQNQTLPVSHLDKNFRDHLQTVTLEQSLGVLEELVGDGKCSLKAPTPPELFSMFSQAYSGGYTVQSAWSQIEQTQIRQVLIEVRSRLLDFILALQEKIGDSMSDNDAKSAASMIDVPGMFSGAVIGDNATFQIGGTHNQQRVSNRNLKGNIDELFSGLRRNGVTEDDLDALKVAIETDPTEQVTPGQFGVAVKAWTKRMMDKAIETSWSIELGVAGNLLTSMLQQYYGN